MKILFLSSMLCVLSSYAEAVYLQSEVDLRIKKESSAEVNIVKAGETMELKSGETLFAIPSMGIPFFIIVPSSQSSKLQLASGDVSLMAQTQMADVVGKTVHEVITGLRKAETLMSKREYIQGLNILTPLKQKYPQVAEIFFLSASLNYLSQNKSAALEDTQKGLALAPEDESGKRLLASLQGGVQ